MSKVVPCTDIGFPKAPDQEPVEENIDIREKLRKMAPDAVTRLDQLMWNNKHPGVALKACELILDRVVPKETKHTEDRHIRITMEKGEQEAAKQALHEAAAIEAEYLEVE